MVEESEYSGMFWHVHHDRLVEWSGDIREMMEYIRQNKPKNEQKTRLKLIKNVSARNGRQPSGSWMQQNGG